MPETANLKFVARQAIMDRNQQVFAYELLYRNSSNNAFPVEVDDHVATARVFFDSLLFFGIDNLSDNKRLFINLSSSSILHRLPKLIKPENLVFEIIERMEHLDQVLASVNQLIDENYIFALDDYDGDKKWDALLHKVKYIKIEAGQFPLKTIYLIKQLKSRFPDKKIVVERIEDDQVYQLFHDVGVDYFQGFYFMKPKLVNFKNANPSQLTAIDLLNITLKQPLDFDALVRKIEKDAAMVSGVLRLSNIRCKSSNMKISSISQAVIYLGEETIKQFIIVLSMADLGEGKPSELLKIGLIRAKFISLLLEKNPKQSEVGYLLGITSILTALLDVDLQFLFDNLSLSSEIQEALSGNEVGLGAYLTLCLGLEKNDLQTLHIFEQTLHLEEAFVMQCYARALAYADESMS